MKIRSLIRRFSFWQLVRLSGLFFQKPLFILPTLKATKRTMTICDSLYGNLHHKNGKANAFRHAFWNILICKKTFLVGKNQDKSIVWAKKVTDLHEKLMPNERLLEVMDLQNNKAGRDYFKYLKNSTEKEIIDFLGKKLENAKNISEVEEVDNFNNELVYISEDAN